MKSTLETWLAGKHTLPREGRILSDCRTLADCVIDLDDITKCFWGVYNTKAQFNTDWWAIDVLDDGTAITYCQSE